MTHTAQVKNLKQSIEKHQQPPIPLEQVQELRDQLFHLPHHGETFRDILNVSREAKAQQAPQADKQLFNIDIGSIVRTVTPIVGLIADIILKK